MNAQKQLAEMSERVRNLTIERDALKSKCEVQRKALAHETMETVKLRQALEWCFRSLCAYLDYAPEELKRECYDPKGAVEAARELLK